MGSKGFLTLKHEFLSFVGWRRLLGRLGNGALAILGEAASDASGGKQLGVVLVIVWGRLSAS
jgi:hypothetical protein